MHRKIVLLTLLFLIASLSWVSAQSPPNHKASFIKIVEDTMVFQRTSGDRSSYSPSELYFSVGDPARMGKALESWLVGVAVDNNYLLDRKSRQGLPRHRYPGYTQGKGDKRPEDDARYAGWIIVQEDPSIDHMSCFHEAIHAYHLSIGSDADLDIPGGLTEDPNYLGAAEAISNQYASILSNLKLQVDTRLKTMARNIAEGKPYEEDFKFIKKRINLLKSSMSAWPKDFYRCLWNIGGKCDWKGYEKYIDTAVSMAKSAQNETILKGTWIGKDPRDGNEFQGTFTVKGTSVTFTGNHTWDGTLNGKEVNISRDLDESEYVDEAGNAAPDYAKEALRKKKPRLLYKLTIIDSTHMKGMLFVPAVSWRDGNVSGMEKVKPVSSKDFQFRKIEK
jgi:hypothetical protein